MAAVKVTGTSEEKIAKLREMLESKMLEARLGKHYEGKLRAEGAAKAYQEALEWIDFLFSKEDA